jgi:hypothetical protein
MQFLLAGMAAVYMQMLILALHLPPALFKDHPATLAAVKPLQAQQTTAPLLEWWLDTAVPLVDHLDLTLEQQPGVDVCLVAQEAALVGAGQTIYQAQRAEV